MPKKQGAIATARIGRDHLDAIDVRPLSWHLDGGGGGGGGARRRGRGRGRGAGGGDGGGGGWWWCRTCIGRNELVGRGGGELVGRGCVELVGRGHAFEVGLALGRSPAHWCTIRKHRQLQAQF